jgi:hypothetical protein
MHPFLLSRPVRGPLVGLLLALTVIGCGDDGIGKTYPVSGKVLLNGKPIKVRSGYVVLKPDARKGNTTPFSPAGNIDADGNYVVYTKTRRGAPPGWYRVVVTAVAEAPRPSKNQSHSRPIPRSLVSSRYGDEKSTPLEIEVVDSPAAGAFDLDLK